MKVLSKVKEEMEFNQGLQSLLETLKSIAVSQFHTLEAKTKTFSKFFEITAEFFSLFSNVQINHPFVNPGNGPKTVVAVTSDKGLLGGLNKKVMAAALSKIDKASDKLVIIGEQGRIFAEEQDVAAVIFPGILDKQRYAQAIQLRDYLIKGVLGGKVDGLMVVYPEAESFTSQRISIKKIIPYEYDLEKKQEKNNINRGGLIWESAPEDIIEYLIFLLIGQQIYEILGISRIAELGARFTHLEESSQKLEKKNNDLKLEYFRIRHELIDRSMRELFSAKSLFQ